MRLDTRLLLSTPYIASLPLKGVFLLLPKQMIQNLSATLDQALRHFIPAADRHLPFVSDTTATDTDDKVIGPEEMDAK